MDSYLYVLVFLISMQKLGRARKILNDLVHGYSGTDAGCCLTAANNISTRITNSHITLQAGLLRGMCKWTPKIKADTIV